MGVRPVRRTRSTFPRERARPGGGAGFALAWPLTFLAASGFGFNLAAYVVMMLPLLAVAALIMGVIVNEVVLPRFRGWTFGMLTTGLRLPLPQGRLWRSLLRPTAMWVPIVIAVYWPFEPVYSVLVWGLVMSVPWRGRSILDRVAGWEPTRHARRPAGPLPPGEPARSTGSGAPPAADTSAGSGVSHAVGSGPRLWAALLTSLLVGTVILHAVVEIVLFG